MIDAVLGAGIFEGMRPDVLLIRARPSVPIDWTISDGHPRPTYVAARLDSEYNFSRLEGQYDLVAVGPIFEVRRRQAR